MRHLTNLVNLTSKDVREILKLSASLKAGLKKGHRPSLCENMVMTQVFEKPSLRTRVSFETAIRQLGGSCIFLSNQDAGLNGRETREDIAKVIGGYSDIITLRTYSQELIETFREFSNKPVINALSDDSHPCQALADILTIEEIAGSSAGKVITYIGDGNNVARSLAVACGHVGAHFQIATPKGYELSKEFVKELQGLFPKLKYKAFTSPEEAAAGSDVIYTDVWASMGQEKEKAKRAKDFSGYQITSKLLDLAKKNVIFLHCLPAVRGEEVDDYVLEDKRSAVFQQAENRMHLAKGLIVWLLEKDKKKVTVKPKTKKAPVRKK